MATWVWRAWSGRRRTIEADRVEFAPEHVMFYGSALQPILAVKNIDCNDLHPESEGDPEWWT